MANEIGKRIAVRRRQLGMSQTDLGNRLSVTAQAVSRWENGHNMPDSGLYTRLAATLQMTVEELMTGKPSLDAGWDLSWALSPTESMYRFLIDASQAHELPQTMAVLPLVLEWHKGQWWMDTGEKTPMLAHPLTMACHAIMLGFVEDEIIASALLHAVPAYCGIRPEELPVSEDIRETVRLLSSRPCLDGNRDEALRKHCELLKANRIACFVDILSRTHFIATMVSRVSREKMVGYVQDIDTYVLPMIEHLRTAWPEFFYASYNLRYHIRSVTETLKWLL